ncbi:MAG TPA: hypothetical protein VGV17_03170 [Bosea sp. (in: a-proteobacteria)]|jgi:hypothetical protein|uniref:hypothetical protein n=1 Tax=Bosea sp. (in: a-proteobacteria) TaxID=1871050 RepID=UPI002DDDB528|nr:hypothetical protein [Bosea sp. (in: a-proteobacteria)]HEV2552747.1 hypothetical protein [Bosea sp. (in: a-proteobacteria)]
MTDEETRETMIRVSSDAAMAVSVAIGGCCPDFDPDPEQVESLLVDALTRLLDEIDDPIEDDGSRGHLLGALRRRKEALDG